jgi:acyl-homoserine-lactone acylase
MRALIRPSVWAPWCLLAGSLALSACGGDSSDRVVADPGATYQAVIERTTYGIPHITANSYGGVGYGHGYAIAEDNLCILADAYVTFRGERSEYFGPSDAAAPMGTFGSPPNLEADFFFRFVVDDERVATFRDAQPPNIRQLSQGFAAGFSRYVREIQSGGHPARHQACRDAAWLSTISEADVYRRLVALNLAASSANLLAAISNASPPAAGKTLQRATSSGMPDADRFKVGQEAGIGSNTLAFGADATESGESLLFANPHWYQLGVDRFYQLQMTIPGELNVSGVSIMGAPMVLMGFNDNIAWAHTVSTASRFTVYALQLAADDPTAYVKDGETRAMTPVTVAVSVKQPGGEQATVTRTLYRSEYGPMLDPSVLKLPATWTDSQAFTLRDVNLENTRSFQNFFAFGHAQSLDGFYDAINEHVGIPWVNTTAIGRGDDRALYSDITAVPNVPDALLSQCLIPGLGEPVLQQNGVAILAGTTSACDWLTDADSRQPGAFGPSNLPHLFRTDYVANMNDSYWLTNADNPLTGFARLIGQEDYAQSLRSRLGHTLVEDRLSGTDGLSGNKASSENLRDIVINSRNLSAELLKDDVLAAVCGAPAGAEAQACQVLSNWDNRGNLGSVGAHLWTALFEGKHEQSADDYDGLSDIADLWAVPFDPLDPVHTPRGLNSSVVGQVSGAFSSAVAEVQNSGVALDAPVRDYQKYNKPQTDIAQFGGEGSEGYFTVIRNTYMHVVDFPEGEPVRAYTFLTNGDSSDPASPYYGDYTEAYSQKQWHRVPFTREQIDAARVSVTEIRE